MKDITGKELKVGDIVFYSEIIKYEEGLEKDGSTEEGIEYTFIYADSIEEIIEENGTLKSKTLIYSKNDNVFDNFIDNDSTNFLELDFNTTYDDEHYYDLMILPKMSDYLSFLEENIDSLRSNMLKFKEKNRGF